MRKIQLPAIGGIRKVIEIPDAGTTISEIGSGSISLAQLAKLITVQQQNATLPTSNTVGDGTEAVLKVGPNLSGGGPMVGTVKVRNDYFSPAYALQEDGPDAPPQIYPPPLPTQVAAAAPPWWTQPDTEFDESMLPSINYPASTSSGGGGTPANPTAKVGLTTINGSATTYMRSDAAPPIDQNITPTWGNAHTFSATSGVSITANGVSGSYAVKIFGGGSAGNNYGLQIYAGENSSDYALEIINGSYSAVYMGIKGDGSGQIGPGSSSSLKWDASGNFTFPAQVSLNAPASGVCLSVPGANGAYALQVVGNNTTGGSDGLEVNAGTNSSDNAFIVTNQGLSATFVQIYGDGSGRIGPSHSVSMQWTTAGAFSFPGSISLSAPTSGVALTVPGANGSYALQVEANNTTGGAFGLEVNAGTNSSDVALLVTNQGLGAQFMKINGDGSGRLGPSNSLSMQWDTSGNFSFPANVTLPNSSTGWGNPTGASAQFNFSGSAATLTQCSAAIASIITALKSLNVFEY